MRVVLPTKDFRKALALLSKAAVRKPFVDSFSWVKLQTTTGDRVKLQTTNGEVYLTMLVPTEEIAKEGETCVEVFALHEAVKSSKDSKFIELYTAQDKLVVKTDTLTQLELKLVQLFPDFPTPQFQAVLPSFVLRYGIEKTAFAVAKNNEKGSLTHLFIDGRGNCIHFVGSDGHSLAVQKLDYDGFDLKVKLYYKSLKLLKELLKQHTEQVRIGHDGKYAYLTNGVWTIAVRVLSEARYPLYEAVIPPVDVYDTTINVSRGDLANALKNFARVDKITIEFFDRKGFKIKTQDTEIFLKADVYGEIGYSLDFNPKRLKEFVDVVGAYTYIEAMFKNTDEVPAMFKVSDNYLYLVMPLIRKT